MLPTQIMQEFGQNFVHRRLIGAAAGFFTGGIPGAAVGFATGSAPGGPGATPAAMLPPPSGGPPGGPFAALPRLPGMGRRPCGSGMVRDASGQCVGGTAATGAVAGGGGGGVVIGDPFGSAVMGRFGAALQPFVFPTTRLRCPRGAVLGIDDLCYNRRDLRKSERKWPPGTKPVLTGGQVNTLRKAQRIQERMKKLGLLGQPHSHRKKVKKLLR